MLRCNKNIAYLWKENQMSQENTTSTQESTLLPFLLLIAITEFLAILFMPPIERTTPASHTESNKVATANISSATPLDPKKLDHLTLMALGLEEVYASSVKRGERLFLTTCTSCHGFDAMGIEGSGKALIANEFANRMSDDEFVAFIKVGRMVEDPLNTTGSAMPGNPFFAEEDLHGIVDYVRSLNGAKIIDDTVVPTPTGTVSPEVVTGLATPTISSDRNQYLPTDLEATPGYMP